jgi:secreted Zn-dependent insulinase-like peptidase
VGPELEGKELETFAVGQFETEEAEKSRRTPDVMDELAKGKTPERQKDTVYPLLRRAEITLSKQETETYKETVKESSTPESCPQDVMDAADEDFGREPLVKK